MGVGVELSTDQLWYLTQRLHCGSLPWVLAITPPVADEGTLDLFNRTMTAELENLGVITDGKVNAEVINWVTTLCHAHQRIEIRYVIDNDMLRGVIVWDSSHGKQVVAYRNAQLVTICPVDIYHAQEVVPLLLAGLDSDKPVQCDPFKVSAAAGKRADDQLRSGRGLSDIFSYLDVPLAAQGVVKAAMTEKRTTVEIVAVHSDHGTEHMTPVGVNIIATPLGLLLVSPQENKPGQWVSLFAPATTTALADAVQELTELLPQGSWFHQPLHV